MMRNEIKLWLCLAAIVTISFACSSGTNQVEEGNSREPASNSESNGTTNTDEDNGVPLPDDLVQVSEGGFAFRPVEGYQLEISGGMVYMLALEADPDVGPFIQIMGMMSEVETTAQEMYGLLLGGTDMQVGTPQEISVDGEQGLLVEISDGEGETGKTGRMIFVVVDGYQQFVMISGSSNADWGEFSQIIDEVSESIRFIQLTPAGATSSLSSGLYAYVNRNVIRDLDEKDGILYAATLGGLVTWRMDTGNFMQVVPTFGMGHISANAVAYCEIPEPRVLVGTLQGISIFNPNTGQWEQNNLFPAESNISTSKIERIFCDQANNRIVVGYTGLGVLDLTTGDFQHYTNQNGLLWNSITDITVNGRDIWIATGYKGIAKISNGQVTNFNTANGMPDESAYALEFAPDGTLWVGASSGLMSYRNGVWELFGSNTPARLSSINEIEVISANSLWVATASLGGGRLCLYNVATATCDQDHTDQSYAPIVALTSTAIAEPIYGTSKGITLMTNASTTLDQLQTSDQLVSNYVDSLAVAPDGMLWVGTDGGVQVLNPGNPQQPWVTYQQNSQTGMGGNWASAIAFSSDGGVFLSMINGSASLYQNSTWLAFSAVTSFNAVAVDGQNRVWFADDGKGIVVLDAGGTQVMTLTTANGLPSDNVQALLFDANGVMWIGTTQGLAKYEGNTLTVEFGSGSSEIPNIYIRALALDQNGDLLIGTFTGVSRYDGQNATTLIDFLQDGLSDARLTTLACRSDGEVWVGTDKGLLHGSPASGWSMMTTANGLLTNYISALTVDQFDAVWVGGGGSNFDGGGLLQIVP